MTALIVCAAVLAYLLVGLCWARGQTVRLQRVLNARRDLYAAAKKDSYGYAYWREFKPWFSVTPSWRGDVLWGAAVHGLAWPGSMTARLATVHLAAFVDAPIRARRAEVAQLRTRRDGWTDVLAHPDTGSDAREAAQQLIAELDDKIERMRL